MKVLWVSSAPIGPVSRVLDLPYGGSSGTWIQAEYESLTELNESLDMFYLCPIKTVKQGKVLERKTDEGQAIGIGFNPKISFGKRLPAKVISQIEKIIRSINPDIIHIWGSESSFTATIATICPEYPKVIFIQGLIGIHYRYMQPHYLRERQYTGSSISQRMKSMLKRKYYKQHIVLEQDAIRAAGNFITDHNLTRAYCNSCSSSRDFNRFLYPNNEYYKRVWNQKDIEKHTIFTIFAADPSKGLAQLLKALNIVRKSIPDVKLYIPGPFTLDENHRIDTKKCGFFEKWIHNYVTRNNLWPNVVFTGRLGLSEMISHYLSCNVFVSPSCMETHAFSVREALALGVPTISSLCGSVNDIIMHNENGLIYRFEEEEVLAMYILKVISDADLACSLGYEAHRSMQKRNNGNLSLMEIYKTLVEP